MNDPPGKTSGFRPQDGMPSKLRRIGRLRRGQNVAMPARPEFTGFLLFFGALVFEALVFFYEPAIRWFWGYKSSASLGGAQEAWRGIVGTMFFLFLVVPTFWFGLRCVLRTKTTGEALIYLSIVIVSLLFGIVFLILLVE